MLKALFKKQMMELNQTFFQDKKKGKAKSKASTILSILLFAVLMIGVCGGIFVYLSVSLSPLIDMGLGWFYFLLMAMVAIALGVFGSVFNTFASLYQAKDNDLLLSMPIPVRYILFIRLIGVYLMGALYSLVVFIPAIIVYEIKAETTFLTVLCPILFGVGVTFIVLILSCILGWLVAKGSAKLKNKSLITVVLSLVFLGAYYFIYFRANAMIGELLLYAQETGESIKNSAAAVYYIGQAAAGNLLALAAVLAVIALLLFLTVHTMSRSFLKLATASGGAGKAIYRERMVKQRTVYGALVMRETKHFLSSATYMLNCGLGVVFCAAGAIALLIKGEWLRELLLQEIEMEPDMAAVLFAGCICLIGAMNDISAASVSMEGKTLWLMQSLPVTPWQVLRSKLDFHMRVTGIPMLLCSICAWIVIRPTLAAGVLLLAVPFVFALMSAALGLMLNLKHPSLNWTSETVAVKQSFSVLAVIFGDWGVLVLLATMFLMLDMQPVLFLTLCLAAFAALSLVLIGWLRKRGTKLLEEL